MRKPKKKKVKSERSKLEEKLWTVFSQYIRIRDTVEDGYGPCCTCGEWIHWKSGDAGHYLTRSRAATKYDEINVHLQTKDCNGFPTKEGEADGAGRPKAYRRFLVEKYGEEAVEALELRSRMDCKRSEYTLRDMLEHYRGKLAEIKKERGID